MADQDRPEASGTAGASDTGDGRGASEPRRDFGDSAGYGGGGSTLDYREIVGDERPRRRANPLDAVFTPMGSRRAGARRRQPRGVRRNGPVVVITGASSGIGFATAEAFARRGADLVLAARRETALEEVARRCEALGGRALVVPTDVRDEAQVQALANQAREAFGGIDIWVNDAAVTMLGRFEDCPPDAFEAVIHTNLFGYVHGARAVLPIFRRQGHGTLINVASMVSYVSQPYASAYAISKAGIRAFTDSLRQELLDTPDIQVCMVLPAVIDTPLFQHAANYTGRAVQAMPPVYPATAVAQAILGLADHPRRQVFVGNAGRLTVAQHAVAPNTTQSVLAHMVDREHLQDRPAPPTAGNLFDPSPGPAAISGGWRKPGGAALPAIAAGLALAALPLGILAWNRRRDARRGSMEFRESLARLQV